MNTTGLWSLQEGCPRWRPKNLLQAGPPQADRETRPRGDLREGVKARFAAQKGAEGSTPVSEANHLQRALPLPGHQSFSSCVQTRCCWGRKWDRVHRGAGSVCSVPAGAQHRRYSLTQNLVFLSEKKGGTQADSTDCSPDPSANFYINRRRFMKR